VKEESINLQNTTLTFKGKSDSKEYALDIEFFKPVDAQGSTYKVLPRSVQMHVMKKKGEDDEEFWPRLLKDKALEKNQVKIDWDRYVDEDEEEEGFDTSNLDGGMGMGVSLCINVVCVLHDVVY
jgi:prostaglandin-E synthase